jgi:uncharacterized protein YyaL (SSP411 family)
LLRVFFNTWLPNKVVAAYDPNDPAPVADLRLLENRRMVNNQPTVYVCERHTCRVPLTEPDLLRNQLRES